VFSFGTACILNKGTKAVPNENTNRESWLLYFLGITQDPIYHTPTLAALKRNYPMRFIHFNLPPQPAFCMHFYGQAYTAA
jgi:hypothetical protein